MTPQKFVLPLWVKTAWKWLRWPLGIAAVIYLALFIWGLYLHGEKYATEDAIGYINSQKLTLADVRGDNLPPAPDAADTSLEGQDANLNGIRDDVELKIFELYPDDIKARAGALQYAKALQLYLTKYVFNSETLVAVIHQDERGDFCLSETSPKWDSDTPQYEVTKIIYAEQAQIKAIEDLVFNTEERKKRYEKVFERYMTSFTSWNGTNCDVDTENI
jgi:hypothetical protein